MRLRGIGHCFRINDRAIGTLHNISFGVCRNRFIAVRNSSNSNGSALLGRLNYLSAPASNRCLLSNAPIERVSGGGQTRLEGEGVNFIFRGCGLLPGAATIRGIRLPLLCGSGCSSGTHHRTTVSTLGTMNLNSEVCRGDGRVDNNRVRHITVTETLIGSPTILLTSRTAKGLSAEASFRVLILFRRLCHRKQAVVFIARGPRVTRCSSEGVFLRSNGVQQSAVGGSVGSTTRTLTRLPIRSS